MGDAHITDMSLFAGRSTNLVRGLVGRRGRYFGSIVSAASVADIGAWRDTAIRCRRRSGRKPCPGHIQVCRHGHSVPIEWRCSSCDERGLISNWRESVWDLSHSVGMQDSASRWVEVPLGEEELRELREISFLDRVNRRVIDRATISPKGLSLRGSEGNFADLLGYIGAEADRESDPRRREILGHVCDRIADMLLACLDEEYDLYDEGQGELAHLTPDSRSFLKEVQNRMGEE